MCGIRSRRSSSTSRKPAVVTSAVEAAAPLEHGVRRHGRSVDDLGDRPGCEPGDRLDDCPVVARRRREQLAEPDAALRAVEDHVGEGAADVDADPGCVAMRGCEI